MKLTVLIESAELRFKQILEDFFISNFDDDTLPSHGLDHHRRVWSYAKELLLDSRPAPGTPSPADPAKLIIACYLHDIGMSSDPGPEHGQISRDICLEFLLDNGLDSYEFQDVADTILYHDRKDYSDQGSRSELLRILSLADDMDAFGFAGIYRYAEIYLLRGADPVSLGHMVLENGAQRFRNFRDETRLSQNFLRHHGKRYHILENFYTHYNSQAVEYDFGNSDPEGHCGLIQLFMRNLRNKLTLPQLLEACDNYRDDIIINAFCDGFRSETGYC